MTKPTLSENVIRQCIMQHLQTPATDLQPLTEGFDSQTFAFTANQNEYVIRINQSLDGFLKDAYAAQHYRALPIPPIYHLGSIDTYAFCISHKAAGYTFQAAEHQTVTRLLKPTLDLWERMRTTDISHTEGFGFIDHDGNGKTVRWNQAITAIGDPQQYAWETTIDPIDKSRIATIFSAFNRLIPAIPEERHLIHGDFGSNNLLTDGKIITAIIDWDESMYGDALFDIATAYFWSPWLDCMQQFADYCEQHLAHLPNYHQRIQCYQLFIGLREIYDHSIESDTHMKEWCITRSLSVINGSAV